MAIFLIFNTDTLHYFIHKKKRFNDPVCVCVWVRVQVVRTMKESLKSLVPCGERTALSVPVPRWEQAAAICEKQYSSFP